MLATLSSCEDLNASQMSQCRMIKFPLCKNNIQKYYKFFNQTMMLLVGVLSCQKLLTSRLSWLQTWVGLGKQELSILKPRTPYSLIWEFGNFRKQ